MAVQRKVLVIMPFGGEDRSRSRRYLLDFLRIKYLIQSKTNVTTSNGTPISYEVDRIYTPVGPIPPYALREIVTGDILLAFVPETNVNVLYELSVRSLLTDNWILVVDGDPKNLLPIYLQDYAYIKYDPGTGDDVKKQIENLVQSQYPELSFSTNIPDALKQAIDRHDQRMQQELEEALRGIEHGRVRRPEYILNAVKDFDPLRTLPGWRLYCPYSILRVKFKGRSSGLSYQQNDVDSETVVYGANEEFLRLFELGSDDLPDPDGPNALTAEKLIHRLRELQVVNEDDLRRLEEDQRKVYLTLIIGNRLGDATVPLRFNERHSACKNEAYSLSLIGKKVIGNPDGPHITYTLVVYIRLKK